MPDAATVYPGPYEWVERGIRRYGFHGINHQYCAERAAQLLKRELNDLRLVTCHLGNGCSLAAIRDGRSVDTTMGFTPLEGLVMATRSGNVDPGLLLWLEEHAGTPPSELAATLEHRSGLLGLAGTPDMREILARAEAEQPDAKLALEVYVHRLRSGIAAMAASIGGLEALVFTGGVGENAPVVREGATRGLSFLGVEVDPDRNGRGTGDREIGPEGCRVKALVVAAREDLEIAREVRQVLTG
jgi:acetate kinase